MRKDAAVAALMLAIDPHGLGGARLRGGPGPARDAWLKLLAALAPEGAPWRRIPAQTDVAELLGGLDLAATLSAGRPALRSGLLAEANGGFTVIHMAERLSRSAAAHIGQALDCGVLTVARDGATQEAPAKLSAIALDEGEEDEATPASLSERLAFSLALDGLRPTGGRPEGPFFVVPDHEAGVARGRLSKIDVPEAIVTALVAAAEALGIASPRAAILAVRAARVSAALAGRSEATAEDAALAARLVLAHRATRIPAAPDAPEPEQPEPQSTEDVQADEPRDMRRDTHLAETVVEAARSALPSGLLA
ncbi:MAG: magnesium chelatase ATPase subunit D, partial [Rubrimonas sp.]